MLASISIKVESFAKQTDLTPLLQRFGARGIEIILLSQSRERKVQSNKPSNTDHHCQPSCKHHVGSIPSHIRNFLPFLNTPPDHSPKTRPNNVWRLREACRRGGGGRGGGGAGKRNPVPSALHHPPPLHRPPSGAPGGRLSVGGNRNTATVPTTSAPSAAEERFSLVTGNPLDFAMVIRLAPDLVDEIKRVEAQGGTARIKFDSSANNPSGNHVRNPSKLPGFNPEPYT
ncbi:dentin sialophosphoprotein-like protein [Actinidia rufa]|uniref:Dentin sialophosphoprotein-like protein n=1 Tax=Actinidia rufa TaxID=165716 RepID=A0A7J0FFC7_9ERIC|nr:dentin sialophosphoprotein-like protein [Actinidia rufa]